MVQMSILETHTRLSPISWPFLVSAFLNLNLIEPDLSSGGIPIHMEVVHSILRLNSWFCQYLPVLFNSLCHVKIGVRNNQVEFGFSISPASKLQRAAPLVEPELILAADVWRHTGCPEHRAVVGDPQILVGNPLSQGSENVSNTQWSSFGLKIG